MTKSGHFSKTLAFIVFLFPLTVWAQIIEGLVLSAEDKSPVPYANISVSKTGLGTVTRFNGRFELDVTGRHKGRDSLVFSAIGFETKKILISDDMDTIFVMLKPNSIKLNSVLVSPKTPEEYIQMAIERIPDNYNPEPFNGLIYQNTMVRLNGKFIESTEAILKGYIMPVIGIHGDSTRIKMLAFNYFDEEEQAIQSITAKKRKKRQDKMAIKGLDSLMLNLGEQLSENFDIYTQIDSNMIKQLYIHGAQIEKTRFWFENLVQDGERQLIKIGFKGRIGGVANQNGHLLLDYESLAIESFSFQIRSSSFKIQLLLKLVGINFNGFDIVFQFKSILSETGWIPDLMSADIFVDMEKIRLFSKNIPIKIELNTHIQFLEIQTPASDNCQSGQQVKKKTPLQDQFKSDPENPLWDKYKETISKNRN